MGIKKGGMPKCDSDVTVSGKDSERKVSVMPGWKTVVFSTCLTRNSKQALLSFDIASGLKTPPS